MGELSKEKCTLVSWVRKFFIYEEYLKKIVGFIPGVFWAWSSKVDQ